MAEARGAIGAAFVDDDQGAVRIASKQSVETCTDLATTLLTKSAAMLLGNWKGMELQEGNHIKELSSCSTYMTYLCS